MVGIGEDRTEEGEVSSITQHRQIERRRRTQAPVRCTIENKFTNQLFVLISELMDCDLDKFIYSSTLKTVKRLGVFHQRRPSKN